MRTFHVELIKPSHYDKDGYVIQWWKAWIPSNSLACLYAIAKDCVDRKILGDDKYGHPQTFPRLALHAKAIAFRHPWTRAWMEFFSTTPAEFLAKVA